MDGKRVKLQLWDTSGQGRFCTIIRSYSRGAQGIFLVYDITNKWSFDGIDRWLKEVEEVYKNYLKYQFYIIIILLSNYYIVKFNCSMLLEYQKYLLVIAFT